MFYRSQSVNSIWTKLCMGLSQINQLFRNFPWDQVTNMYLLKYRSFLLTRNCQPKHLRTELKMIIFYEPRFCNGSICIHPHLLRIISACKVRKIMNIFFWKLSDCKIWTVSRFSTGSENYFVSKCSKFSNIPQMYGHFSKLIIWI